MIGIIKNLLTVIENQRRIFSLYFDKRKYREERDKEIQ